MSDKQFKAILTLILPKLISLIAEKENMNEIEATNQLYQSELYTLLEDEDTKLWHFSPLTLYHMYEEERRTGKITFPEEG
ncbi:hypothetical protein [Anaerosinus massiliensis]|uniref:hypothetical protein n=1 Tax=Massilibacillus massiliensis TaxID=1806837 RepID=UPI000DA63AA5|nr:hypothetical protein [Massilibacillus massiliensis]